eukprot:scaffold292_cov212-Pinguiococcus_pyrenoidosus.AAC.4
MVFWAVFVEAVGIGRGRGDSWRSVACLRLRCDCSPLGSVCFILPVHVNVGDGFSGTDDVIRNGMARASEVLGFSPRRFFLTADESKLALRGDGLNEMICTGPERKASRGQISCLRDDSSLKDVLQKAVHSL